MKTTKKNEGIALFTILVVAAALLAILSVGLKMGSDGVLFVSQAHKRNVALSAAEAGVYEAMILLLNDKNFSGSSNGTLADSQGTYELTVNNDLYGTRIATVTSIGEFGGVRRALEVELEPDSAGFNAISVDGKVYIFDYAYVNGIASTADPLSRPGNSHTEYDQAGSSSYKGEIYDSSVASTPRLHGTGTLSTQGFFHGGLARTSLREETNVGKPQFRFDRAELLSGGSFTPATVSAETLPNGKAYYSTTLSNVTANTVVGTSSGPGVAHNEYHFTSPVTVPKGTTLHVQGDAKFLAGIRGEGNVVVDGDMLVRTNGNFDPSLEEGLKVLVGGTAFVAHPEGAITNDDVEAGTFDVVGDFFARMPPEAPLDMPVALPTSAPHGGTFFQWFDSEVDSPDAEFNLWYNGDGTDIHPGLTTETKNWLNESRAIQSDITSWAAGP